MTNPNPEWIFLDVGGVILNDDKPERLRQEAVLKVARKHIPHLALADVRAAWLDASHFPGTVRTNALRVLLKGSPHLAEAEAELARLANYDYRALSTIRPAAAEILNKLSQRYKLGIMANQSPKTTALLETAGLLPYLSHHKLSGEIGLEKPDPLFYKTILADAGADPHRSVLVDDNWYRGLVQARHLGMGTVLFHREIIPAPESADPDFTITRLEELITIFD
jgi:HAD superfamily hydrolase (TIGR01509 family)